MALDGLLAPTPLVAGAGWCRRRRGDVLPPPTPADWRLLDAGSGDGVVVEWLGADAGLVEISANGATVAESFTGRGAVLLAGLTEGASVWLRRPGTGWGQKAAPALTDHPTFGFATQLSLPMLLAHDAKARIRPIPDVNDLTISADVLGDSGEWTFTASPSERTWAHFLYADAPPTSRKLVAMVGNGSGYRARAFEVQVEREPGITDDVGTNHHGVRSFLAFNNGAEGKQVSKRIRTGLRSRVYQHENESGFSSTGRRIAWGCELIQRLLVGGRYEVSCTFGRGTLPAGAHTFNVAVAKGAVPVDAGGLGRALARTETLPVGAASLAFSGTFTATDPAMFWRAWVEISSAGLEIAVDDLTFTPLPGFEREPDDAPAARIVTSTVRRLILPEWGGLYRITATSPGATSVTVSRNEDGSAPFRAWAGAPTEARLVARANVLYLHSDAPIDAVAITPVAEPSKVVSPSDSRFPFDGVYPDTSAITPDFTLDPSGAGSAETIAGVAALCSGGETVLVEDGVYTLSTVEAAAMQFAEPVTFIARNHGGAELRSTVEWQGSRCVRFTGWLVTRVQRLGWGAEEIEFHWPIFLEAGRFEQQTTEQEPAYRFRVKNADGTGKIKYTDPIVDRDANDQRQAIATIHGFIRARLENTRWSAMAEDVIKGGGHKEIVHSCLLHDPWPWKEPISLGYPGVLIGGVLSDDNAHADQRQDAESSMSNLYQVETSWCVFSERLGGSHPNQTGVPQQGMWEGGASAGIYENTVNECLVFANNEVYGYAYPGDMNASVRNCTFVLGALRFDRPTPGTSQRWGAFSATFENCISRDIDNFRSHALALKDLTLGVPNFVSTARWSEMYLAAKPAAGCAGLQARLSLERGRGPEAVNPRLFSVTPGGDGEAVIRIRMRPHGADDAFTRFEARIDGAGSPIPLTGLDLPVSDVHTLTGLSAGLRGVEVRAVNEWAGVEYAGPWSTSKPVTVTAPLWTLRAMQTTARTPTWFQETWSPTLEGAGPGKWVALWVSSFISTETNYGENGRCNGVQADWTGLPEAIVLTRHRAVRSSGGRFTASIYLWKLSGVADSSPEFRVDASNQTDILIMGARVIEPPSGSIVTSGAQQVTNADAVNSRTITMDAPAEGLILANAWALSMAGDWTWTGATQGAEQPRVGDTSEAAFAHYDVGTTALVGHVLSAAISETPTANDAMSLVARALAHT